MATVAVVGAGGRTAAAVAATLTDRGHEVVTREHGAGVDLDDPASLRASLGGADLVVAAVSAAAGRDRRVLDAAIAAGAHHVGLSTHPATVHWALTERAADARRAGTSIVVAAAFEGAVGDLLAHLAGTAAVGADAVHVCYAVPTRGGYLRAASPATRRAIATDLGGAGLALRDGQLVEEQPGEERRLAWFPRPVGPVHAAGVPGVEPLTVPSHLPGVRTVRSYLALSTWRAELLQAAAAAARWPVVRERLARRVQRPRTEHSEGVRWACVAEAAGRTGVARAWAYGTDPRQLTATIAVAATEAVVEGRADVGVLAPAMVEVPTALLDRLSAASDLRWSVARPEG